MAYLLAWCAAAEHFPFAYQAESHKAHVPSKEMVKFCLKEQFAQVLRQ